MTDTVVQALSFALIYVVSASLSVWLIKVVVSQYFSRDIEKYKANLGMEADHHKHMLAVDSSREIERLKTYLLVQSREQEVRFSKLHEKRAEIMSELHSFLYEIDVATGELEFRLESRTVLDLNDVAIQEEANNVGRMCERAVQLFRKNQLYFSEHLADQIELLIIDVELLARMCSFSIELNMSPSLVPAICEHLKETRPKLQGIMRTIKEEFRAMLGSEVATTKSVTTVAGEGIQKATSPTTTAS